jgi:cyclase
MSKRLIAVVTVRGNWVVQSFGYHTYLPVGRVSTVVENLDRWAVDEIFLCCIDRSGKGPNLEVLQEVMQSKCTTPVAYGGGIMSEQDALSVIKAGADRLVVDQLLVQKPHAASDIVKSIGKQALIGLLPCILDRDGGIHHFDYMTKKISRIDSGWMKSKALDYYSELIITDKANEGSCNSYESDLIYKWRGSEKLIAFGGVGPDIANELLKVKSVNAVAVGNMFLYQEHAVQSFKNQLNIQSVRPSYYNPFRTERMRHAESL